MTTFAPLSRENRSNWGGQFGLAGTNAKQEQVTVWMLGDKTLAVAVASFELSVEGALQFWLKRRVDIITQFHGGQTVSKGNADQFVDGGLVQ